MGLNPYSRSAIVLRPSYPCLVVALTDLLGGLQFLLREYFQQTGLGIAHPALYMVVEYVDVLKPPGLPLKAMGDGVERGDHANQRRRGGT